MTSTAKQAKRRRQRDARRRKAKEKGPVAGDARVLLERPVSTVVEELRALGNSASAKLEFEQKRRREISRDIHPIVRLGDAGIDWGVMPEAGDQIGYGMHPYRSDDCLRAAIATATQIAVEQVPDPQIDHRLGEGEDPDEISRTSWTRIEKWADSRGLSMKLWAEVPVPRDRWIGVCWNGGGLQDHCLVMVRGEVLFNPDLSVVPPPGTKLIDQLQDSIVYGLSFDPKEKSR